MSPKTCLKITPTCIYEIKNYKEDPYYKSQTYGFSCSCLNVASYWEKRHYDLVMIVKDRYDEDDEFNPIATYIYNNLKGLHFDNIYGTVYLVNEQNFRVVNFNKTDLKYIMKQLNK
jgi:hypothetical protein